MNDRSETAAAPRRRAGRPLVLFLLLLISLAAGGMYAATTVVVRVDNVLLPGVDLSLPKPIAKAPGFTATPAEGSPGTTRINILVLGVDRRPHHDPKLDGPPNADSIHLLSLDPVTKTASALAFPRDLYLEMPNPEKKDAFIEARINTAYRMGVEHKYPGGGPGFVKRVIEYNFHLPVDYYAVIDWVAFADVIDALGGIWINVEEEMKGVEGFNPWDGNAFRMTIPAGWQYMDAITALAYARFRGDEESDFGRIRRQQEVMRAAADEALRRGWTAQGPQLYNNFRSAVDTDLTTAKLPGIINLVRQIGIEKVKMVSLAGQRHEAVQGVITPWGEDVLVPIWEVLSQFIRGAIDDRQLTVEGATVTVFNASGVRGRDERAAAYLRRFLIPPERISAAGPAASAATATNGAAPASDSAASPAESTTITFTGEASETASRIASWLGVSPGQVSRVDAVPGAPNAVVVTLGKDVRLPDDERFLRYRPR